jgi:hypothetical protein
MIRASHQRRNFRNGQGRMGDATSSAASAAIGGGISAGVQLAIAGAQTWLNSINTSHAQMTGTTEIANRWAQQMGNLTNAYLSEPSPTCADQRAALDAFDQAWAWLQSSVACGNPSYGAAGLACIADRAPGGKFDATRANRDPIANDPRLAGMNCDSSQELLLPTAGSSTFSASGITAAGQPDVTTNTAAPAAVVATASTSTIPTWLYAAFAIAGIILLMPSGGHE